MHYISTRASESQAENTFKSVVFSGLCPSGGLYIPSKIPICSSMFAKWETESFASLCTNVFSLFVGADTENPIFEDGILDALCQSTFGVQGQFNSMRQENVDVVKLHLLSEDKYKSPIYILELFHGPTFAFKDVALQFLGNLLHHFQTKKEPRKTLTVIGATSGDTGGAAIYALRGKPNIEIFILHPKNRISQTQFMQMCTVMDSNVHNVQLEGSFDDCQDIVKKILGSGSAQEKSDGFRDAWDGEIVSVNSINWASYLKLRKAYPTSQITYTVPTGNFGDVLAGYYAQKMGCKIKLVIATNINDILVRFLETGTYECVTVKESLSPAMDICVSSNFERMLWYLSLPQKMSENAITHVEPSKEDAAIASSLVTSYMKSLKLTKSFTVSAQVLANARELFQGFRVSDSQINECIASTFSKTSYVLDPHTAVGIDAVRQSKELSDKDEVSVEVVIATAHPGKFPDTVHLALESLNPPDFIPDGLKYTGDFRVHTCNGYEDVKEFMIKTCAK